MEAVLAAIKIIDLIKNPITYLMLVVIALGYALWWVVKFALQTMSKVIEANTSSHTALMGVIGSLTTSMKEITEAVYRSKEIIDKCHIKNESKG